MTQIMSTRLPKKSVYEKKDLIGVSAFCDWFICGDNVIMNKTDCVPDSIFISSYKIAESIFFFSTTILPTLTKEVVLVIASEDVSFPLGIEDVRFAKEIRKIEKEIDVIMKSDKVKHIFVENLDLLHKKLSPIPLGFHPAFDKRVVALYEDLMTCTTIKTDREINVFCSHRLRIGEQWKERHIAKGLCLNAWRDLVVWKQSNLSQEEFKNNLLKSKFCICVRGGGIDPSPRAWMALLCGCFLIMKDSKLNSAYNRFPVIFVKEWNASTITQSKIKEWNQKYDEFYKNDENRIRVLRMLTLAYWQQQISRKINS